MNKKYNFKLGDKVGNRTIIEYKVARKFLTRCICGKEAYFDGKRFKSNPVCYNCLSQSHIGKRNFKLFFIKKIRSKIYEAKCDCGNICKVRLRAKSCGCHRLENLKKKNEVYIGVSFHHIKILKYLGKHSEGGAYFLAKCVCGNKFEIKRPRLFLQQSCGCRPKDLFARGSNQGNSKYTEEQIRGMKELFASDMYSSREISEMFNIKETYMLEIIYGKAWKHITVGEKKLKSSKNYQNKLPKKIKKVEVGEKYGEWTIIKSLPSRNRQARVLCRCSCGNVRDVIASAIRRKKSTKCYDCNAKNLAQYNKKKLASAPQIAEGELSASI